MGIGKRKKKSGGASNGAEAPEPSSLPSAHRDLQKEAGQFSIETILAAFSAIMSGDGLLKQETLAIKGICRVPPSASETLEGVLGIKQSPRIDESTATLHPFVMWSIINNMLRHEEDTPLRRCVDELKGNTITALHAYHRGGKTSDLIKAESIQVLIAALVSSGNIHENILAYFIHDILYFANSVAKFEEQNQMTAANIGMVIASTITALIGLDIDLDLTAMLTRNDSITEILQKSEYEKPFSEAFKNVDVKISEFLAGIGREKRARIILVLQETHRVQQDYLKRIEDKKGAIQIKKKELNQKDELTDMELVGLEEELETLKKYSKRLYSEQSVALVQALGESYAEKSRTLVRRRREVLPGSISDPKSALEKIGGAKPAAGLPLVTLEAARAAQAILNADTANVERKLGSHQPEARRAGGPGHWDRAIEDDRGPDQHESDEEALGADTGPAPSAGGGSAGPGS